MKSKIFEERTKYRDQFQAVDVLGSFDFSTAVIYLKSLVTADIEKSKRLMQNFKPNRNAEKPVWLTAEQFSATVKIQPLAAHEFTHFIDATSTLWGLRHLQLMANAYASIDTDESNFHKAKEFDDHVRRIRLPKYYTVVYKGTDERQPWASRITIGRIFDKEGRISKKPVLFSQFLNADGEMIVRSPISTISILEASAMAQEVITQARLLKITDPEFRVVEDKEFSRKSIDFLYNRELTEYSVCIHILANKINCKDALIAFSICAVLTRVALNFPAVLFDKLANTCPVEDILNIPVQQDFGKAFRDGLMERDLGVVYYLLCNALPENVVNGEKELADGIVSALNTMGIDVEEYTRESANEAESLAKATLDVANGHIKSLILSGLENFKRINFFRSELILYELNLPPVLLGDDAVIQMVNGASNLLEKYDVEESFFSLDDGMSWVRRFTEACV